MVSKSRALIIEAMDISNTDSNYACECWRGWSWSEISELE